MLYPNSHHLQWAKTGLRDQPDEYTCNRHIDSTAVNTHLQRRLQDTLAQWSEDLVCWCVYISNFIVGVWEGDVSSSTWPLDYKMPPSLPGRTLGNFSTLSLLYLFIYFILFYFCTMWSVDPFTFHYMFVYVANKANKGLLVSLYMSVHYGWKGDVSSSRWPCSCMWQIKHLNLNLNLNLRCVFIGQLGSIGWTRLLTVLHFSWRYSKVCTPLGLKLLPKL